MKFALIGCGNMGEVFLANILSTKIFSPEKILVIEQPDKIKKIQKKYSVKTSADINQVKNSEIIFLAFKPQNLSDIDLKIKNKIIISILAGTSVQTLNTKFPENKIIRAMPNIGQFVNQGMTGVFFPKNKNFSKQEKAQILLIFEAGGKIIELKDENQIDDLTAISGSGPAYFFFFIEKLIDSAHKLGFSKEESTMLVKQTLFGATEIIKKNPKDEIKSWRKKVTSKGGTTEAALNILKNPEFEEFIFEAIYNAKQRAEFLK